MNEYKSLAPRPVSPESLQAFKDRIEEYRRISNGEKDKLEQCRLCEVADPRNFDSDEIDCSNCVFGGNCSSFGGSYDRRQVICYPGSKQARNAAEHRLFVMEKILEDYLGKFGDTHA